MNEINKKADSIESVTEKMWKCRRKEDAEVI